MFLIVRARIAFLSRTDIDGHVGHIRVDATMQKWTLL